MLQYGDGVNMDKYETLRYYKIAADQGDTFVMTNLTTMLSNGDGIGINKAESLSLLQNVSWQGNDEAMVNYAIMLKDGDGVPVGISQSIKYLKTALNGGNARAAYELSIQLVESYLFIQNCHRKRKYSYNSKIFHDSQRWKWDSNQQSRSHQIIQNCH